MGTRFFNNFREVYQALTIDQRRQLAELAEINENNLWQIQAGHKQAGISTVARLQMVDPRLDLKFLRPDLFEENNLITKAKPRGHFRKVLTKAYRSR